MAIRNLKSIIGKKKIANPILQHIIEDALGARVWIEDEEENLLVGEKKSEAKVNIPVMDGMNVLGRVKGGEGAEMISELLQMLINKEAEKKTLGNEVLLLYREINLIYNYQMYFL